MLQHGMAAGVLKPMFQRSVRQGGESSGSGSPECPTPKELGHSPTEKLPGAKHAGIPRNVSVPKANAKSRCGCLRAGLDFGTVQAWILAMRGYRPQSRI